MEIQKIIRSYYKSLHSTKLENLDKMDNFLDTYQVAVLKQDQINHLNSPIIPEEIESVLNRLPTNWEFYQIFKEDLIPILFKVFHKRERQETLPNLFYEITILLIPKPNKDQTRKENFRPISFMNIASKILKKFWPTESKNASK